MQNHAYHQRLRAMYPGRHAGPSARRFARVWAAVFSWGVLPRRWVTLEVPGRRTGRPTRFPLGMARWQGQWYLVSMLGNECNWVANVRAADGRARLHRRTVFECGLREVPVGQRAPILKQYLSEVPGARAHIPIDRHAPVQLFETIAAQYPVFLVTAAA